MCKDISIDKQIYKSVKISFIYRYYLYMDIALLHIRLGTCILYLCIYYTFTKINLNITIYTVLTYV